MNDSESSQIIKHDIKLYNIWKGNNKFFCKGKIISGYY